LHTDEIATSGGRWSYILLAEELRRVSAEPKKDAHELFRRMTFNALISNIDDHPRNHAILANDRNWRLSPAYDLTPANPISEDHRDLAMAAGDQGRWANAGNLLSQGERFLLSRDEASARRGVAHSNCYRPKYSRCLKQVTHWSSATTRYRCRYVMSSRLACR
jgi:serine/threonine-protein kinase HipA